MTPIPRARHPTRCLTAAQTIRDPTGWRGEPPDTPKPPATKDTLAMNLIDLIDNAVTNARVGRGAQREAARFARSVRPGHTYWSIVDLNCKYPGAPTQALVAYVFKRERFTGFMKCGSMDAAYAWLNYGPLHDRRPGNPDELMTYKELSERPDIYERAELQRAMKRARPVPAGV